MKALKTVGFALCLLVLSGCAADISMVSADRLQEEEANRKRANQREAALAGIDMSAQDP